MYAVKKTEHFTLLSRQVEKRSRFLSLNAPKLLTCPTKTNKDPSHPTFVFQ